jgi:hypothetical protein
MRMSTSALLGLVLIFSGCTHEPKRACTPPNGYWQKPHNFVGLMPPMNHVGITQDGRLHWNGKPISSAQLRKYLRQSHQLNPEPVVFLETEMGVSCDALAAVRTQMDEALECKKSGRCAEGIQTVWQALPTPPGTPIS